MFRCQYSGELSEPAEYRKRLVMNDDTGKKEEVFYRSKTPETGVKIVVETRQVTYSNYNRDTKENVVTYGIETVKELLVRSKYVDDVKSKYRL